MKADTLARITVKGVRVPRKKGTGEGSLDLIVKDGKKVWQARWQSYDADGHYTGRPKRIVGTLRDYPGKKEARARLLELMAEEQPKSKALAVPKYPTFEDVWRRFVASKVSSWSAANRMTLESLFSRCVLPLIGPRDIALLTPEPLQAVLDNMLTMPLAVREQTGYGRSAIAKVARYLSTVFEWAADEGIISSRNPTNKISIPRRIRKSCERYFTLDEVRRLIAAASGRERIVIRLLIECGLRPGELFALRTDDIEPGVLRVDEAVSRTLGGGQTLSDEGKTGDSIAPVAISQDMEQELRLWASALKPGALLFSSRNGTPIGIGNYLKRTLKPMAERLGIEGMTHQAFRRTFTTHFQRHGTVKEAQTQLRHSRPETTLQHYQKVLPDGLKEAVESFSREIAGKGQIQ